MLQDGCTDQHEGEESCSCYEAQAEMISRSMTSCLNIFFFCHVKQESAYAPSIDGLIYSPMTMSNTKLPFLNTLLQDLLHYR